MLSPRDWCSPKSPGIDVRRDVLDQMEFAPWKVADDLKAMDAAFFADPALQAQAG